MIRLSHSHTLPRHVELPQWAADQDWWADIGIPLVVAIAAAAVVTLWPALVSLNRARRFRRLIKRELQEIRPVVMEVGHWTTYLPKRFVHEGVFAEPNLNTNRDFLLSLNPASCTR